MHILILYSNNLHSSRGDKTYFRYLQTQLISIVISFQGHVPKHSEKILIEIYTFIDLLPLGKILLNIIVMEIILTIF